MCCRFPSIHIHRLLLCFLSDLYQIRFLYEHFHDHLQDVYNMYNLPAQKPILATRGIGEAPENDNTIDTSAGIATPLIETPGTREYYDSRFLSSSDGLFVLELKPVKKVYLTDADNNPLKIEYTHEA